MFFIIIRLKQLYKEKKIPFEFPTEVENDVPIDPINVQNPYGGPGDMNPYGPPSNNNNPYGPPSNDNNPYGQPPSKNPYGQPPSNNNNPYGQPSNNNNNPYGSPPNEGNPYGPPQNDGNPYGAPPDNKNDNISAHLQIMAIHMALLQITITIIRKIPMDLLKEEIIILIIINKTRKIIIHMGLHMVEMHLINLQELNLMECLKAIMMIVT